MSAQLEEDLASGAGAEVLVPGDAAGYQLLAETLRGHARLLDGTGDRLSRVEPTNWRGQASTGFLQVIAVEPGRWRTAADAFTAGAVALEGFVASLIPARDLARQATQLYQQYQALLASAGDLAGVPSQLPGSAPTGGVMGVQDRMRIGARYNQMAAIAAGGALRGPGGTVPGGGPLAVSAVGAADALRRRAIALLDQARRTVEAAGNLAADALTTAMEQAPAARRFTEATIRPAAITAAGHTTLDTAGLIPGIGEVADGANALWYAAEADTPNAAISAAGMLPLIGDAATSGRMVYRGTTLGKRAAKAYGGFRGPDSGSGWLRTHEIDGSHTLAKHQGKSDKQLVARLRSEPRTPGASSFASTYDAERFTEMALRARQDAISAWLAKADNSGKVFIVDLGQPVGRGLRRGETTVRDMASVQVYLVPDARFAAGYRVYSCYPTGPAPRG